MKEIQLTQGKFALVDDDMFEELNQHKWCVAKGPRAYYGVRNLGKFKGKYKYLKMHHAVIGKSPNGFEVDHINGKGFDNRKCNLRFVTRRQNCQNKRNIKTSSRYPGVCWDKNRQKWKAQIKLKDKSISLGRFQSESVARDTYCLALTKFAANGLIWGDK